MKKNVKKSLRQYESLKLRKFQLRNVKGGDDTTTTTDIVIEDIVDP